MRWPSGPLEIARREKGEGFTPQAKAVLERWHAPATLDFLKGAPVNCLVVSWAAGLPEDASQQKTAGPLVAAARQHNLSVIGWVEGSADHQAAIASAQSAGLSAVAIKGFQGKSDFTVIPWGDRASAPFDSTAPVLPVTENVWPGVRAGSGDSATAGPTGVPWIDSNGWYIQLARARARRPVWVMFDPPGKGAVIRAQSYPQAIADSEASGGRWVISLDDGLRAGLTEGQAAARETWKGIARAASFFEQHREWKSHRPLGLVGVISDYAGENYDMSGEILNCAARRDLLFRVIWKSLALAESFTGLKALVYADKQALSPEHRQKLLAFVEQGGLLLANDNWGSEGKSIGAEIHRRFDVRALGKGRLAVAKEELVDPYQVAADAHVLLSRANDQVRFFNSSSAGCSQFTGSADGKRALLQVINYVGRGGGQMTVWTRRSYRAARLWSIASAQPVALGPVQAEQGGTEYHLPPMPAYGALDFEV